MKWWMDKIAYQIYPKSFNDSNGDGIGDLDGIIEKLDYLKELGIDIIWISPVYASPLVDQGYDISDYYQIHPVFGDLETMDRLIAEAKKRDIRIIMDLVVNHCSDEHEWFQKALQDPDGEYGNYFYIAEKKDGKLPCNWRSYFGGSVWEQIPGTDKYYFHAFHKKQPDLNWENPKVRREIYDMINWWFERGISGFRIDAIINIKKRLPFCDYEPDREDGLCSMSTMLEDAKGVGTFLEELKKETFEKYDAFTVGEVFNDKPEEIEAFIGRNGHFSSKFDFAPEMCGKHMEGWFAHEVVTAEMYKKAIFGSQQETSEIGYLSNIIENHDEPRGVSHFIPPQDISDTSKKALAAAYFFLKGIPFIYQGQEIGMENCAFTSMDQIDDISTKEEYKVCLDAGIDEESAMKLVCSYSRDHARTPFQWNSGANAGFSKCTPWMMVNPNYTQINLEEQQKREDSVFSFYRKMIALRKDEAYKKVMVLGKTIPLMPEIPNLIAYTRETAEAKIAVVVNFQPKERTIIFPFAIKNILLNNDKELECRGEQITLKGYQAVVIACKQFTV